MQTAHLRPVPASWFPQTITRRDRTRRMRTSPEIDDVLLLNIEIR